MDNRPAGKNGTGLEILIVEDSLTQAEQLRYILERHGFNVTVAANGREALTSLAAGRPDLIISDVVMPEMDGYELCRRIKDDENCREIPVILLTALSDPQDVMRGLECGADNFITKPYNGEYLASRIMRMQSEWVEQCGDDSDGGVRLSFAGQDYVLHADRRRILNLLLSTYETAIQKNRELSQARDELHTLNEQLKVANRELEAFCSAVSHDLRSPLNIINLYCQVMLELCDDFRDREILENIRGVFDETRRMNQLITTLLNFSRLTRREINRSLVDLTSIVRELAGRFCVKEPERRVEFVIKEGVTVTGDDELLTIVMENLLGNAWKYTGMETESRIEFGTEETGGRTAYFVRDNGVGFDMGQAGGIFTPFRRLHDQTEFAGTGIGLATVQRIIQRHGGRVWAVGEVGRGATFYFTL